MLINKNKSFELLASFKKAKTNEDGSITIRGMASTTDIDRAGDIIISDAWKKGGLENFKKNPIILFNHNYDAPIGKAIEINTLEKGLELVVKISKAAAANVHGLIEDGILGAFSVGFRIRDADYMEDTGGLLIKDAELYEVSVVSVPCNQEATFSLAKSFDSEQDYEDFKQVFKNDSVNLASQSLAKNEANASDIASDTQAGAAKTAQKGIKMNEEELKAYAKQIAADAAEAFEAKMAAKEAAAAEKAENDAAAKKAKDAEDAAIKSVIQIGLETGAEKLVKDFEIALAKKDADMGDVIKQFEDQMKEHKDEITAMRNSKAQFSDRSNKSGDLTPWAEEFLAAKMVGVITGKGFNTDYAKSVMEKAGIDYATSASDIDQTVAIRIEKEIVQELRAAGLFREVPVIAGATVLPIQPDSDMATFQKTGAPTGNLQDRGGSGNKFEAKQVILNAYRLISSSYIDNDTDEQVLVNLMPMIIDAVARAHARAVDNAVINGSGSITGLAGYATAAAGTLSIGGSAKLTAAALMAARGVMGKYGMNPQDVAYIVSMAGYYQLINDADFSDISEVGSDMAMKVVGTVGGVYGSPVIVSDNFPAVATTNLAALAVNVRNYVRPKLRGINLESDYEVANQRRVIVASQSLGFEELVAGAGVHEPAIRINYIT